MTITRGTSLFYDVFTLSFRIDTFFFFLNYMCLTKHFYRLGLLFYYFILKIIKSIENQNILNKYYLKINSCVGTYYITIFFYL